LIKRFSFEERAKEISMFLKVHSLFGDKDSGKKVLKGECSFSLKKEFKEETKMGRD